jgi:hypothetical protein
VNTRGGLVGTVLIVPALIGAPEEHCTVPSKI